MRAPIQNDRSFRVIALGGNTYQLGDRFDASQAGAGGYQITFAQPHDFQIGDRVQYHANGGGVVSGLSDGGFYYVRPITPTRIELYTTAAAAQAPSDIFDPNASIAVQQESFTPTTDINGSSFFTSNPAGFRANEGVIYRAQGNTAIGNLADGHLYFVVNLSGGKFQLSNSPGGSAITLITAGRGGPQQAHPHLVQRQPG